MKKIISLVLLVVILLVLSSCDTKSKQSNDIEQSNEPENVSSVSEQITEQDEKEIQTNKEQVQISVDDEALNPELPTDLTFARYYEKVFVNDSLAFSSTHWFYNWMNTDMSHYHEDQDGSLIERARYYNRDNDGKVIRQYTYDTSETIDYVEARYYEYNEKGLVSKETVLSSSQNENFAEREDYDYSWIFSKTDPHIEMADHPIDCILEYSYFDNGEKQTKTETYYKDDGVEEYYKIVTEYSLDGTWKQVWYRDGVYDSEKTGTWKPKKEEENKDEAHDNVAIPEDGIVIEQVSDIRKIEYKYSENGFLIYKATYDNNIKMSQTVYQYDQNGKAIKEMEFVKVD